MSFELASRKKYRYPSIKGELTTEMLWELPLQSKSGFDLDNVAKDLNRNLKAQEEDSFVESSNNPLKGELANKLEIVKHVIAVKQAENKAMAEASVKRAERQRLEEILHIRKEQDLMQLSPAEIQAKIDALGT